MKWKQIKDGGGKGGKLVVRCVCVCVGEGVKSPRLFSTFCIMTLAWFHTRLRNDKYRG